MFPSCIKRTEITLKFGSILEDSGFAWPLTERKANVLWEEIFALLEQFKKREGHCNVPWSQKEDGASGAWRQNKSAIASVVET